MINLHLNIQKMSTMKKKVLYSFALIIIVIQAMSIFPLRYEISILNALMVSVYLEIGVVLSAMFRNRHIIVFLIILATNMIGFALRVWLEWGEFSMRRDLTIFNVLSTYIPICITILIGYLLTNVSIENNNVNTD